MNSLDTTACILRGLASEGSQQAWADFLAVYSPVILQVARLFETDPDHVADCFLFACEQLSQKGFQRLRRFRAEGPASFETWLRVVVHRLCLDWRRKEFGRARVFDSIAALDAVERDVFRCVYQEGLSQDAALLTLHARYPSLTERELADRLERVRTSLSPRQLWLLGTARPRFEPLDAGETGGETPQPNAIRDPAPDPEMLAAGREERAVLLGAVACLPHAEQLLVRLRYEQELTLAQVARLAGLPDAQTADRRLGKILDKLRDQLGKALAPSV